MGECGQPSKNNLMFFRKKFVKNLHRIKKCLIFALAIRNESDTVAKKMPL